MPSWTLLSRLCHTSVQSDSYEKPLRILLHMPVFKLRIFMMRYDSQNELGIAVAVCGLEGLWRENNIFLADLIWWYCEPSPQPRVLAGIVSATHCHSLSAAYQPPGCWCSSTLHACVPHNCVPHNCPTRFIYSHRHHFSRAARQPLLPRAKS